jgi:hypothetical protein
MLKKKYKEIQSISLNSFCKFITGSTTKKISIVNQYKSEGGFNYYSSAASYIRKILLNEKTVIQSIEEVRKRKYKNLLIQLKTLEALSKYKDIEDIILSKFEGLKLEKMPLQNKQLSLIKIKNLVINILPEVIIKDSNDCEIGVIKLIFSANPIEIPEYLTTLMKMYFGQYKNIDPKNIIVYEVLAKKLHIPPSNIDYINYKKNILPKLMSTYHFGIEIS